MASNFGLSGLSGVYGGYLQGQAEQQDNALRQQQIDANKLAVQQTAQTQNDLGNFAASLAMDIAPAPQQMQPGQPSQPMQPPAAPAPPQPTSASVGPQPTTAPQPLLTTSGGAPASPPGGYFTPAPSPAAAPSQPGLRPSMPQAQPTSPPAPSSAAAPSPIIAPPNATVQPVQNVPAPQSSPPGSFVGTTNAQPGQQVQFNGRLFTVAQKDQRTGRALMVPARNPASSVMQSLTAQGAQVAKATAGQWTVQQLARQIIKSNPGIQNQPARLLRAIEAAQHLLQPDQQSELKALQVQQKLDQFQQNMEYKMFTAQERARHDEEMADVRLQIANLQQSGANNRLIERLQSQADQTDQKYRQRLVSDARKLGVKVTPEMTSDEIGDAISDAESAKGTQAQANKSTSQQQRAVQQQMDSVKAQMNALRDKLGNVPPENKAPYDKLSAQLAGLGKEAQDLGAAAAKRAGAPPPSARPNAAPSSSPESGGVQAGRDARIHKALNIDAQIRALQAGLQTPDAANKITALQDQRVALAKQDDRAIDAAKRGGVDTKKYGTFSAAVAEARLKNRGAPSRPRSEGAATSAGSAHAGTADDPATPQTQADFDALSPGTYYIDPSDNQLYQK